MITRVRVERETVYACSGAGTFRQSIKKYKVVRQGTEFDAFDKLVELDGHTFSQIGDSLRGYSKGSRRPLRYNIIEYLHGTEKKEHSRYYTAIVTDSNGESSIVEFFKATSKAEALK